MNYYNEILKQRNLLFPPELEFGCEVEFADIGIWGHEANHYLWVINDVRNNEKGDVLDNIWQCTQRGWTHTPYSGWKPKQGYGDIAEILETKDGIKTLSHHYSDKIEILGLPVSLNDVLLMMGKLPANTYPVNARITEYGRLECTDGISGYKDETKLDLTLPIKDQDEETLIKILSLIE